MSETEYLKLSVDLLFRQYSEKNPAEELSTIEKYLQYLADHIDHRRLSVDADLELLQAFEAVTLLLKERLRLYPDSVLNQVTEVLEKESILRTLSVLANMSEIELRQIRYFSLINTIMEMIGGLIKRFRFKPMDYGINPSKLFGVKIGLRRIAQIIKYASTIDYVEYDGDFDELRDHYNFDLINKTKVIALINTLKVQIQETADQTLKERIEKKIDRIEEELRKPKPKWGRVITSLFVLLGFLADVKSIAPSIYSAPYNTVQHILSVIHEDGVVQKSKTELLLPEKTEFVRSEINGQNLSPLPDAIMTDRNEEGEDTSINNIDTGAIY